MATPWTASAKTVPGITNTAHTPTHAIATSFVPPAPLPSSLPIPPKALYASTARCGALARVPPALNVALSLAAAAMISEVVDDAGASFDLVSAIDTLADVERTSMSARVGNGITDLYMSQLGYVWRDLASALIGGRGRLADFAYDGGPASGHGLVLAEAKCSLSVRATPAFVTSLADGGYRGQVQPHLGATTTSGQIVHGYAVAFGAKPAQTGAHIHVAQTTYTAAVTSSKQPRTGAGSVPSGTVRVAAPMALGNYRAVYLLANAPLVYHAIESALQAVPFGQPHPVQMFRRVRSGDRHFLFGADPTFRHAPDPPPPSTFAIAEDAAEPFLDQLSAFLAGASGGLTQFDLPVLPTSIVSEATTPPYILFADGFAYLLDWSDPPGGETRNWSPRDGLSALKSGRPSSSPRKFD